MFGSVFPTGASSSILAHRMLLFSVIASVAVQLLSRGVQAADLPPGVVERITIKSPKSDPAAKLVKIKHGPYTVPGNGGMVHNAMTAKVTMPCTNCYVTALQAGLEYPDGSDANIDTGAWLHHMYVRSGRVRKSIIN